MSLLHATSADRASLAEESHNPNIVVNGDAEYVVALKSGKGQAFAESQGGLQEQEVRDTICQVMEGGKDAFRDRYRRIAVGVDDV